MRWYFLASLAYLALALLAGLLMALQLVNHNPLRGIELLSPGRWRMVHTNAIAYGFLANAFLGILHWVVPRLTLRPVFDVRLSWFIFGAWQVVVISTAVGILLGEAQGVEWGETPVWIDPLALAGLLLVAFNILVPIFQRPGPLYVSLWYFTACARLDAADLRDGEFYSGVFRRRDRRRSDWRIVHPRSGRPVRHADRLGDDVLFRADHSEEADLEPRAVVGRLLGPGVLLSVDGHPSFSVHADSDVSAIWRR